MQQRAKETCPDLENISHQLHLCPLGRRELEGRIGFVLQIWNFIAVVSELREPVHSLKIWIS